MYGDLDTTLPREVPLSVKLRMLFGGWLNQFGWAWLAFSSIFIWVGLGIGGTVSNPPAPTGTVATAKGVITEVNKTNTSINKSAVWAYHFKFQASDGKTYDGAHKAYEGRFKVGQPVTVQYSPAKPADRAPPAASTPIFEPLMYDPLNPARAVMLDDLPGCPRLDQAGQIQGSGLKILQSLILPLLTVGGNVAAWQIMLRHRTW